MTEDPVEALYTKIKSKTFAFQRNHSFNILQKPVQLIKVRDAQLEVCEDGLRLLKKIKIPMKSVGIFGKPNSGKGLLLNCLTGKIGQSYKIKNESALREGIWFWGSEESQNILYINCNTFEDDNKEANARLIALMTMLSSVVIYNSLGPINHNDLKCLTSFAFLRKISINPDVVTDLSLIWVLRSFEMNLPGDDGPMTANDYMHEVLHHFSPRAASGFASVTDLNNILESIFTTTNCIAMTRPTYDEDLLVSYEKLQTSDLEPRFLEQLKSLTTEIDNKLKKKSLFGVKMTGTMTAYLLEELLICINTNTPVVSNSILELLTQAEYKNLVSKAKETYFSQLDMDYEKLPITEVKLFGILMNARQKAEHILAENMTFTEAMRAEADEELNILADNTQRFWVQVNAELSDVHNQALADRLLKPVQAVSGEVVTEDSYSKYLTTWNSFIEVYRAQARGVNRLRPVMKFLSENQTTSFYKHFSKELDKFQIKILSAKASKASVMRVKNALEAKLKEMDRRSKSMHNKIKTLAQLLQTESLESDELLQRLEKFNNTHK
eukprot:CAMPEP_0204900540 /NCGR_PEP_ID=MMETSP1397-20131031/2532_1 /ASSEMBLY_ACC=CAM_ASM_000891 /TAXON_ID=49980 /ORGANISM="Climacostomum Climacostomum virens, Strain Stock W-24" /LENGTH=552 /DNA_ID=CAMNT_0052068703 /DNA_START=15 /DNA_END=1673 /DNA_ORIENTATION=+